MTAQHNSHDADPTRNQPDPVDSAEADSDPIGPITLPKRGRLGARAAALAGSVGLAAVGIVAFTDGCSTFPTIAH
ncbi:hypothetical protein [Kribbella italica]|uniref:Uncharacterized protein n=1 Tax=Kribbella italica TaxID=1540520 RepID=A0A7W9MWT6_9ACTN|nr:hypothetical protein [Kribbella italica]MBB5838635.1 hypothetical protein [Kribbella italica]